MTLCAGNSPVTGEVPAQRPVTRSFDVFFDLCLNKRLSKHSWGWWFETPWRPLWRHCNVNMLRKPSTHEYHCVLSTHRYGMYATRSLSHKTCWQHKVEKHMFFFSWQKVVSNKAFYFFATYPELKTSQFNNGILQTWANFVAIMFTHALQYSFQNILFFNFVISWHFTLHLRQQNFVAIDFFWYWINSLDIFFTENGTHHNWVLYCHIQYPY